MQGGPFGHGFDKNELVIFVKEGSRVKYPIKFAAVVTNYMSDSSFTNYLPHLEGEEVFGSSKQLANCPPSVNNDSHCPNDVNFFHP